MKALIVLVALFALTAAQILPGVVTTGEGLTALGWNNGIGRVELSTSFARRTDLSANLPRTFTFECWFITPQAADGLYKTIVTRYRLGSDGKFHNRWADFTLQVQKDGTLNVFSGNGLDSTYGFNLGSIIVESNVWHHVAFSISTLPGRRNPYSLRIVINGLEFMQMWSGVGNRQELRNVPIVVGDYQNQDGDTKFWVGGIDEIRFWTGERTLAQLNDYKNSIVPLGDKSGVPLAYYRLNEGSGVLVADSSPNQFHGAIVASRGVVSWILSGVKAQVTLAINHTETKTFTLSGASVNGSTAFYYVVSSLPSDASGNLVGKLSTPEGVAITTTPFILLANQVVYEAPSNINLDVNFSYYGATLLTREETPTTVTIMIGDTPCISKVCGRCQDSARTTLLMETPCSCLNLPYFGYNYTDIERIVFLFEVEKTLDLMSQLEAKLEKVIRQLVRFPASYDLVVLINEVQAFNRGCLRQFCENFTALMANVYNPTPINLSGFA